MSLQPHFQSAKPGIAKAIATSPWSALTAIGAAKQVLLYDNASSQFLGALPFESGRANVLRFSPNGELLLAAGGRQGLLGKVFIWNVETTELVSELAEETDTILAADISADHGLVAVGAPQKMLRVVSTQTDELLYEIKKHTDWITAIAFSPDGVLLASADRNGGLMVWEAGTGNEYLSLAGHGKTITTLAWRADANVLASGSDDGAIKLWEMERGKQIKSWAAHGRGVNGIDFGRSGQLVSVGREAVVKLWKQDGKLIRQFKGLNEFGVSVQHCDETNRVLASDFSGAVHLFESGDGKKIGELSTAPRPLKDELASVKVRLNKVIEKAQPLEKNVLAVTEKLQQLQQQLAVAIQDRDQTNETLQTLQLTVTSTDKQIQSARSDRALWQQELTGSQNSLPDVEQAAQSAQAAAERLPGDSELQELANKLQEKLDALGSRAESLDQMITQSVAGDEQLESKLSTAREQIGEQTQKLQIAGETIKELQETQIAPVEKRKQKLAVNLDQLKDRAARLRKKVEFFEAEIEFDSLLQAKLNELQAAKSVVADKNDVLNAAKAELEKAQAHHDAKMSSRDQAQGQVQRHEAELMKMRSKK